MIDRRELYPVDCRGPAKRPVPWGRDMTVCIAAICQERPSKEPRIVLCSDARMGGALGSSDWAFKQVPVGNSWYACTAGEAPDIRALVKLFERKFVDPASVTAENIDASIKDVLSQRRRALAEQFTQSRFAISFEEFSKHGKARLPDDLFREATRELREIDLKAEFILAGFIDGEPEIYTFDGTGHVCAAHDYAVCGSGYYLAHAALLRREQNVTRSLEATIYSLYEAKCVSESVGSVGKRTSLGVLFPDGRRRISSDNLDEQLAQLYVAYGPKQLPAQPPFKGLYYYDEEKTAREAEQQKKPEIPGLEKRTGDNLDAGSSAPESPENKT